ncbi:uncharacterized protein LOC123545696 [Mercenaria mercenaria]|uniref:uncharacterized protein LOC123545696 n=1 Tax=Mercenaria mercenaria TaxID=6596 RepID=UPI00234ED638|nr:uncharacterized protein LOC123545696 [Mercenaria mercenaria]
MGNRGSRCKGRGLRYRFIRPEDELFDDEQIQTEDFDGTTSDSYEKLIGWMIEMAENDQADLSSLAIVEHLTTVSAEKHKHSTTQLAPSIRSIPSIHQNSYEVPVRQHSFDSSCSSLNSRSSRSGEVLLNPKTRFRREMLSRQSTVGFSDDSEVPHNRIVSGSFDSDTDTNFRSPDTIMINNNIEETSFTNRLRHPLRKHQVCTTYRNYNTSFANLLNISSRKRSKSLMTMRKMLSETRNDEEITPTAEETVVKVLDNEMLDGNMADILYSIEALWPKAPKYLNWEQKGYSLS